MRNSQEKTESVIVNSDFCVGSLVFAGFRFLSSSLVYYITYRTRRLGAISLNFKEDRRAGASVCFADASLPHCRNAIRRAYRGSQPVRATGERYRVVQRD